MWAAGSAVHYPYRRDVPAVWVRLKPLPLEAPRASILLPLVLVLLRVNVSVSICLDIGNLRRRNFPRRMSAIDGASLSIQHYCLGTVYSAASGEYANNRLCFNVPLLR